MLDRLPELLCPAGSPKALEAAIEGGADAVYFGGSLFNARINAQNFSEESMRESIALAHAYSVKCYMTLNTLVYDRELESVLRAAAQGYEAGVDALIVADLGVASLIHKYLPDLPLHASTQASGHSVFAATELQKLGFSRMVMAREASLRDIRYFCKNSDMELEVFTHGALCVCHSGQCLFSSLVGGRSGNRGECAQPCRLPFSVKGRDAYPLSLRDLCLAPHIPELIDAGVTSLKIEGRMKSPEYVRAVASVYRKLLDECRAATSEEIAYLESVFSRGGFTDGYFAGKINGSMLGVRSESDKQSTRELEKFDGIKKKIPIDMKAEFFCGTPSRLTVSAGGRTASVVGDEPQRALTQPMTAQDFEKNLSKLGATPYIAKNIEISLDDGIMLPVSRLNALRRAAVEAIVKNESRKAPEPPKISFERQKRTELLTASFAQPSALTEKAKRYFDVIFLPLDRYAGETNGVAIPPVVFDSERERVIAMLDRAVKLGAKYALVGNLAHISLAREFSLIPIGDIRLNITNSESANVLRKLGIERFVASPELTLPMLRDISGEASAAVYGKLPLMLLEKCVIRELGGCLDRQNKNIICSAALTDRTGARFPVLREGRHRNIVYNSLPTSMSDREQALEKSNIKARHFIFSDESPKRVDQIIDAFVHHTDIGERARRIADKK